MLLSHVYLGEPVVGRDLRVIPGWPCAGSHSMLSNPRATKPTQAFSRARSPTKRAGTRGEASMVMILDLYGRRETVENGQFRRIPDSFFEN